MDRSNSLAALRRAILAATPLVLATTLAACGGGDGDAAPPVAIVTPTPTPAPTPTPTPTPTPSPTSRNVTACLNQVIPGTNGATPASLVVPDTIKIDLTRPAGFPNGRRLQDSVVDITLAVLFLDVNAAGQSPLTFTTVRPGGLNPQANDINGGAFLAAFPFVLPPQGNPPLATGTGTSFNFRTDPFTSYVRVDREGMPAVATAVIGAALKNAYNDAGPAEDAAGTFVPEIVNQLTLLHNALADDLIALGLKVCST
jgi:hypothetical protein